MDDVDALPWMARRLTFGGWAAVSREWEGRSPATILAELLDPAAAGIPAEPSPWVDVAVPEELSVEAVVPIVSAWLDRLGDSVRPLEARMSWLWHDYFAVSADRTRALYAFTDHLELLRSLSLGSFAEMLRSVTIDPAMLVFLDGTRNARGSINENYGRELLELYGLGVGNYTEDDVRAAAVALSGWVWRLDLEGSMFLPRRHDATPQMLLGRTVSDLDGVIETVIADPACGRHVAGRLAERLLGVRPDAATLERLGHDFHAAGHDIAGLVGAIVEIGLSGPDEPVVMSPVEWLVQTEVLTGASMPEPRVRLMLLRQMGQLPGMPPNVGGYPGAETWAGPSAAVGRFRAASAYAARTDDDAPVLAAARHRDWEALARLAGRPAGFSDETIAALDGADTKRLGGREALAAALMSPEMVIA